MCYINNLKLFVITLCDQMVISVQHLTGVVVVVGCSTALLFFEVQVSFSNSVILCSDLSNI